MNTPARWHRGIPTYPLTQRHAYTRAHTHTQKNTHTQSLQHRGLQGWRHLHAQVHTQNHNNPWACKSPNTPQESVGTQGYAHKTLPGKDYGTQPCMRSPAGSHTQRCLEMHTHRIHTTHLTQAYRILRARIHTCLCA